MILTVAGFVAPLVLPWSAALRAGRLAMPWLDVVAGVGLCALALAIRLPSPQTYLPFVHGDEAACGNYGRLFNSGQAPLLSIGWYDLPMMSYAISGLGLHLFGDTLAGLRLINIILGSLGVVLTYLLGRELFSRRAALLAGAILAVTFLHIDLSRDGIHYIQAPTFITLTLYLVARWLRRGGAVAALLAGMSLSLNLQVYYSSRIVFVIVALLLAFVAWRERQLTRERLAGLAPLAIGLLVATLPVIALFLANPTAFNSRQQEVSLIGALPGTLDWVRSAYGTTDFLTVIQKQFWLTLNTFYTQGDASEQIGWVGSMVDTVTGLLLPPALVLALVRWRQWPYALCALWFLLVVGAGILTINAPWWPRLAAMLPAMTLLLGAALDQGATWLARRARSQAVAMAALAVILLPLAIGNWRVAFVQYPAVAATEQPEKATLVGQYLASAPDAANVVLLSDGSFDDKYDPIRFLAPNVTNGCTLVPNAPLSSCPNLAQRRLFVLEPGRVADLGWLEQQRPGGQVVRFGNADIPLAAYVLPAGSAH